MNRPRWSLSLVRSGSFLALLLGSVAAVETAGASAGPDAGESVRAWMCGQLPAYGLVPGIDSLRVEYQEPLPGGLTRLLVQQTWHGIPVLGADARAIVEPGGRIRALIPNFASGLNAPLSPRIDAGGAAASARGAARFARFDAGSVSLAVARRADGDHLVWSLAGVRDTGEPTSTVVDATSGDVLDVDAGVAHAVGRVYPIDPRDPLEERELPRLLAGPGMQSAEYSVDDATAPPAVAVAPGDYRFDPSDPAFDQVNLYWHVDHYFHDFMGSLGYAGPPDPVLVRLHFALDPEVARTAGRVVTLGQPIPNFTRETSRAADIVYHELGHAVVYGFGVQPGGARREASALHEALADYFAAALTNDPVIGEWLYIVFPNGCTRLDRPSPPFDLAHYDVVAFGGGGASSAWGNSMIISSGLWDLRQRIGSACDSLVLESLAYLPTVPTWAQFVNGMFFADRDHHGGAYWRTIGEVLGHRGVSGVVAASISGDTQLAPGETTTFRALDCCGSTPGHYQWRARDLCHGIDRNGDLIPCSPWRDMGDADSVRASFLGDTQLELIVESPFGVRDTSFVSVGVTAPSLVLQGPTRILKGAVGTWSVRVVASEGWGMFVYRQWLVPGKPQELIGNVTRYSFAATDPFRLTAQITDGLGRSAIAQLEVTTFTDHPPQGSGALVRVTQRVDGSRQAEVHVELGAATVMRLGVYDIRGRERLLLADEGLPRGERVYRWDTTRLEPGVYFLRAVTAADHADNLRFVVLR